MRFEEFLFGSSLRILYIQPTVFHELLILFNRLNITANGQQIDVFCYVWELGSSAEMSSKSHDTSAIIFCRARL